MSGPVVTYAEAQQRAEAWINEGVPSYQRREVRVREFDLGFVAWAVDRAEGPSSDGGAVRLVIARDSGVTTLWPALPINDVVRRYEEAYGRPAGATPTSTPSATGRDRAEATSFLLSPPQWLEEAGAAVAAEAAGFAAGPHAGGPGTPAHGGAPGQAGGHAPGGGQPPGGAPGQSGMPGPGGGHVPGGAPGQGGPGGGGGYAGPVPDGPQLMVAPPVSEGPPGEVPTMLSPPPDWAGAPSRQAPAPQGGPGRPGQGAPGSPQANPQYGAGQGAPGSPPPDWAGGPSHGPGAAPGPQYAPGQGGPGGPQGGPPYGSAQGAPGTPPPPPGGLYGGGQQPAYQPPAPQGQPQPAYRPPAPQGQPPQGDGLDYAPTML